MNLPPEQSPPPAVPQPQKTAPGTLLPPGAYAPGSPSRFVRFFTGLGRVVAALATLVNLVVLLFVLGLLLALFTNIGKTEGGLRERFYAGNDKAQDKIAVIRIEGVLFEGLTDYAINQIDAAAKDDRVKAVVVRITSPGGTITASDNLHKRLNDLRNGKPKIRYPGKAKPIVVSMGSVAASGGYYIAMIRSEDKKDRPTVVLAEPATVTGSIGVYASFPNIKGLAEDYKVKMNVIKAGDIKTSGSPFRDMTPEEQQVWQHMVDDAYLRFLGVITQARGLSKEKLQEDVVIKETVPIRAGKEREKHLHYTRYRADGGIFMAEQAVKYGLIDRIGYLPDAVQEAAKQAGLAEDYKAVTYDRPRTFLGSLLGIQASKPSWQLDADSFASAAAPRLWYLAPQHELTGLLTALGR
jgi:protease-4